MLKYLFYFHDCKKFGNYFKLFGNETFKIMITIPKLHRKSEVYQNLVFSILLVLKNQNGHLFLFFSESVILDFVGWLACWGVELNILSSLCLLRTLGDNGKQKNGYIIYYPSELFYKSESQTLLEKKILSN